MEIKYKLKTAPSIYPVTLTQLKNNLHVLPADTSQDAYLQELLYSAIDWAQARIGRQLCRATYTAYLSEFPSGGDLLIHFGPVAAISTVKYYASGEVALTTMSSTLYELDNINLTAVLRFTEIPDLNTDKINPIEVEFTNGWSTAAEIPKKISDAIILYASERYLNPENRQANFGTSGRISAADNLLREFKPQRF
jgi:uncharacterized phiE125 gp8 family phage protein